MIERGKPKKIQHPTLERILQDPTRRTQAVAGAASSLAEVWQAAGVHERDIQRHLEKVFEPDRTRGQLGALIQTANELISGDPHTMVVTDPLERAVFEIVEIQEYCNGLDKRYPQRWLGSNAGIENPFKRDTATVVYQEYKTPK